MPTLCKTVIEFGVNWDAIYCPWRSAPQVINCILTSIPFNNLYLLTDVLQVSDTNFQVLSLTIFVSFFICLAHE